MYGEDLTQKDLSKIQTTIHSVVCCMTIVNTIIPQHTCPKCPLRLK